MSLLDYLRQPFETMDKVPKEEIDMFLNNLRKYNFSQDKTKESVEYLLRTSSYLYAETGSKASQVLCIKKSLQRQLEVLKLRYAKDNGIELSKKSKIENMTIQDVDEYSVKLSMLDEAEAALEYIKNIRESLYMIHYQLRSEFDQFNRQNHKVNDYAYHKPQSR